MEATTSEHRERQLERQLESISGGQPSYWQGKGGCTGLRSSLCDVAAHQPFRCVQILQEKHALESSELFCVCRIKRICGKPCLEGTVTTVGHIVLYISQ